MAEDLERRVDKIVLVPRKVGEGLYEFVPERRGPLVLEFRYIAPGLGELVPVTRAPKKGYYVGPQDKSGKREVKPYEK